MKKKTEKTWTASEEWDGKRKFYVFGARFEHCSGAFSQLEFELPDIKKEYENDLDYIEGVLDMGLYRKFPEQNKNLKQTKVSFEDMWTHLLKQDKDPIKFGGCKVLKIRYVDEPRGKFHFI